MRLTDLNAAGGIGANSLLIELGDFRVLVDAGMHPKGIGKGALPRFELLNDKPLDLIFLTHCHLDHLGGLPVVSRAFPSTPILTSPASEILLKRMLHNSCSVMQRQKAELSIGEYPLFTRQDIEKTRKQVIPFHPGHPRFLESRSGERLALSFHNSGHVPGAVGILLEHNHRKIFFSGDVLFQSTPILDGARFPKEELDTIVLETTRGETERKPNISRNSEIRRLLHTVQKTCKNGGSILIPTFALGRMQELLTIFHEARKAKILPRVPIYTSGLGMDLVDQFDRVAEKTGAVNFRRKWLKDLPIRRMPEGHRAGSEGPAIYALSSGMMVENTPSFRACKHLLPKPENVVAFIGYCDPSTPGGRLIGLSKGEGMTFSEGRMPVPVAAKIEKFDMSGHADREELLEFALARNPRNIVLHHGDPAAQDWFEAAFKEARPEIRIIRPRPLLPIEI